MGEQFGYWSDWHLLLMAIYLHINSFQYFKIQGRDLANWGRMMMTMRKLEKIQQQNQRNYKTAENSRKQQHTFTCSILQASTTIWNRATLARQQHTVNQQKSLQILNTETLETLNNPPKSTPKSTAANREKLGSEIVDKWETRWKAK